jgi:hypothetical protein
MAEGKVAPATQVWRDGMPGWVAVSKIIPPPVKPAPPPSTPVAPSLCKCGNCGRVIGSLEQPYQWGAHVVCAQCLSALQQPVRPQNYATPKQEPFLPDTTGKAVLTLIVFFIVFFMVFGGCLFRL